MIITFNGPWNLESFKISIRSSKRSFRYSDLQFCLKEKILVDYPTHTFMFLPMHKFTLTKHLFFWKRILTERPGFIRVFSHPLITCISWGISYCYFAYLQVSSYSLNEEHPAIFSGVLKPSAFHFIPYARNDIFNLIIGKKSRDFTRG